MFQPEIYGIDTETTSLSPITGEPVEISIYRLSTNECREWHLKPITISGIESAALKVNGIKLEDLLHKTAEGREKYRDPNEVITEIENWLMDDGAPTDQRILLGHNVYFDREMLVSLWNKCGALETFPWNTKYSIDTMTIEFSLDYASKNFGEGYSLRNLAKKYGVKQIKAHSASDDTRVMVEVFREQMKALKGLQKSE